MPGRLILCSVAVWLAVPSVLPCAAEPLFWDDFHALRGRYEFLGNGEWTMKDGRCRIPARQFESFAVVNLDERDQMRIEATVPPDRRLEAGYAATGLTVFLDPDNHWCLLLVASPDDKPYFELIERCQGVHQAQSAPPPATLHLDGKHEGSLQGWKYGRTYRLILSISPDGITGEVQDSATKEFWRQSYTFASARAVRRGRPGMTAGNMEAVLQSLAVDGPKAASASQLAVKAGKAGSVAIVEDDAHRVATALEPLFARAGYGVTRVNWDDLQPGRLSAAAIDLVILADARRLPAAAVPATLAYLRSGGKLVALGAPAFGELLLKTPQGYVTQAQYAAALYDALARQPLNISPEGWVRGSYDPKRPGQIQRDGQGWKATVDLDGWDYFSQPIPGRFAQGRTVLTFRARGDAQTPQLYVECTEKDSSRWIATVELSTDWRPVVLRPTDFGYWPDSKARRGGAGDRFEPANVASIQIGLSRSHTPQCNPGPHTFWFQDLAAAPDPNPDQANVNIPDIEGFCPSYKLYPVRGSLDLRRPTDASKPPAERIDLAAYAPVPRETGIGFDRGRQCRWMRTLDAYDASGRNRGSIAWLMLGEEKLPGAAWASFGLADPQALLDGGPIAQTLQTALLDMAQAMTRGCFLLEAGSRYFSYHAGEPIELGALVVNSGRQVHSLEVSFRVTTPQGQVAFEKSAPLDIPAAERQATECAWTPGKENTAQFPYTVTVQLRAEGRVIDQIAHRIELLPDRKAGPEEFVRVEGSQFKLDGKPWYMLGVNYWPNSQGGRPTVPYLQRAYYNPDQIEQDLTWMQAAGINLLSGVQALVADPDSPNAYRDLADFLERCRRHQMKVFYFLYWGNPMSGANLPVIKQHIEAAGLKDHPAILGWDIAWEPIYYSGPAGGQMDFLLEDWNAWIVERYGSLDNAERDWNHKLPRTAAKPQWAALPDHAWCVQHGAWARVVAAFRQFFSDRVGQGYGEVCRELRRYDPKHLISFRFGACGIPDGARFAHAHSASVAKHVDFLCPEGYNLQTGGFTKVTPADDLRKGGLVTLFYRFLSREKPVVWMEFGYTVNGMHAQWKTADVLISARELANQRVEYENFYRMFLESGARGAAPWWLPGGFRLGEESDFGLLEPDCTPRPACEVIRQSLPKFALLPQTTCVASSASAPTITLDLDAHYPDSWSLYGGQYLAAVKAGPVPSLRTEGTGTTSANCPLVAVGNTPLTGHNPPKFLNAEFNAVELKAGDAPWREIRRGEPLTLRAGEPLRCRVSVGNTAEASWQAAGKSGEPGIVCLACRLEPSGKALELPLAAATPYLHDGEVRDFPLPVEPGQQTVTFQMCVTRTKPDGTSVRIPFGQKRSLAVNAAR